MFKSSEMTDRGHPKENVELPKKLTEPHRGPENSLGYPRGVCGYAPPEKFWK